MLCGVDPLPHAIMSDGSHMTMLPVPRFFVRRLLALILLGLSLVGPAVLSADTAQYFYDELGRLAGVIDGQG